MWVNTISISIDSGLVFGLVLGLCSVHQCAFDASVQFKLGLDVLL